MRFPDGAGRGKVPLSEELIWASLGFQAQCQRVHVTGFEDQAQVVSSLEPGSTYAFTGQVRYRRGQSPMFTVHSVLDNDNIQFGMPAAGNTGDALPGDA